MSKRFIAVLAGALAIAALAVGCGGGGDGSETTSAANAGATETSGGGGPALSKAEFIERGDEICIKAAKTFAKGVEDFMSENGLDQGQEPSQEQQEQLVGEVILPAYRVQAEELAELAPPAGEEQQVEEVVAGFKDAVAEGEADPSAAIADDPFADAKAKAQEFGFTVCGEG